MVNKIYLKIFVFMSAILIFTSFCDVFVMLPLRPSYILTSTVILFGILGSYLFLYIWEKKFKEFGKKQQKYTKLINILDHLWIGNDSLRKAIKMAK